MTSLLPDHDIRYALNVSVPRKYIYIANPKAGSSTVRYYLQAAERRDGVLPPSVIEKDIYRAGFWDQDFDLGERGFFVFSFVRNPFARALSCYLNKINTDSRVRFKFCFLLGYPPDADISFTDFLEAIASSPQLDDVHWRCQSDNLLNGSLAIDCIGHVEHMEDDLRFILARAGAEGSTSQGQAHATDAGSMLHSYYGPHERALAIRKYTEDFERFGYGHDIGDIMPKKRRLSLPCTNRQGFSFARAVGLERSNPHLALRLCLDLVSEHQDYHPYVLLLRIARRTDPDLADAVLLKLLGREDLPAELDSAMAAALLSKRRYHEARTCAALAIRKAPLSHHVLMAKSLVGLKLYPAALEAVDTAIRLSPRPASPLLVKAMIFKSLGEMAECERHLEDALAHDPAHEKARAMYHRVTGRPWAPQAHDTAER